SVTLLIREPEIAFDPIQPGESDTVEPVAAIHQLADRPETTEQISVLPPAEPLLDLSAPAAPAEVSAPSGIISEPVVPIAAQFAEPLFEAREPFMQEDVVPAHESLSTPISEPGFEASLAASEIKEYSETEPEEVIDVPASVEPEAIFLEEAEAISPAPEIPAAVELELEPVSLMEAQAFETRPELIAEAPAVMEPDAVPLA